MGTPVDNQNGASNVQGNPRPTIQSKTWLKIEQIARMRVAGISVTRMAMIFGVTEASITYVIGLPEYAELEQCILLGTTTKMDEALACRAAEMRKVFAVGVPAAMRALVETVNQRRDLRSRMEAAKELLDRDPQRVFSKGSIAAGDGAFNVTPLPEALLNSVAEDSNKTVEQVKTSDNAPLEGGDPVAKTGLVQ